MDTMEEVMTKATNMEEIMIETVVDPEIILGRVKRHMGALHIDNQGASSSRRNTDFKPQTTKKKMVGGGFLREPYLT
jgi:hypothetical protein